MFTVCDNWDFVFHDFVFQRLQNVDLLGPSDVIWRHKTWSTLPQEIICCRTVPIYCLTQYCLTMTEALWYSPELNFTGNAQDNNHKIMLQNYTFEITAIFVKGDWVNISNCRTTSIFSLVQYVKLGVRPLLRHHRHFNGFPDYQP